MTLRNRNILVTGGAGFIGSEIVHQLFEQGAMITVVDNLTNGKREHLADLASERVKLETIDIRDAERMRPLLENAELVLHLACLGVRHSIHSPLENHEVNASGTLRLLELARHAGVRRFVHVSSSEIYGTAQTVPMNEQHPTSPMTVYGASKLAGERYAHAYWRTHHFPTVVVRPFNAFGPRSHHEGDCGEVIPKFMLRALAGRPLLVHGNGTQTRDFTYVADTARCILLAASAERAIGETINIGSDKEISIQDLAKAVAAAVRRNDVTLEFGPSRPGDVRRLHADSRKAAGLLGYVPQVSLEEGLKRLWRWYESSGHPPEMLLAEDVDTNWHPAVKQP